MLVLQNPQYQKVEAEVKHLKGRIRQETKDVESSKAKDADRTAQREFLQAKLSKLEAGKISICKSFEYTL